MGIASLDGRQLPARPYSLAHSLATENRFATLARFDASTNLRSLQYFPVVKNQQVVNRLIEKSGGKHHLVKTRMRDIAVFDNRR